MDSRFSGPIQEEALERAVNQAYQTAIAEKELVPLSSPVVDNVKYNKDEPLEFRVAFEVRPEVEAKDYRNVSVKKRIREIGDEDVDQTLERLQQESAKFVDVERAAGETDVVVVDHVRVDEKGRSLKSSRVRNAPLELGSDALLQDFKDALVGAETGDSRTVEVSYPEDFSNQELAGKKSQVPSQGEEGSGEEGPGSGR